jgi:hypothetical protein
MGESILRLCHKRKEQRRSKMATISMKDRQDENEANEKKR